MCESDIDQATRQVGMYAQIMREENDACDLRINARELSRFLQFIESADLPICKAIVDALTARVIDFGCSAAELEAASAQLAAEIECEMIGGE